MTIGMKNVKKSTPPPPMISPKDTKSMDTKHVDQAYENDTTETHDHDETRIHSHQNRKSTCTNEIDESHSTHTNDDSNKQDEETTTIETTQHPATHKKRRKKVHTLSLKETENFNAKLERRGIVYLSRIPPRMGPAKVKALLGDFGVVTRVYLVEEDKSARKRRLQGAAAGNAAQEIQNGKRSSRGGGGGKRYTEGWVEFEEKKIAKKVGRALNNTPITNHKRNVHYGDMWSVKYLPKFKWSHLTEKVAYERRVREQKMRLEMMKAKKENQLYSELVEAGKVMDHIEERRKKRKARNENDNQQEQESMNPSIDIMGISNTSSSGKMQKVGRSFRQTKPIDNRQDHSTKAAILSSLV